MFSAHKLKNSTRPVNWQLVYTLQPRLAAKAAKRRAEEAVAPGVKAAPVALKKPKWPMENTRGRGRGYAGRGRSSAARRRAPAAPLQGIPAPAYPIGQGVSRAKARDGHLLASFLN